MSRSFKHKPYSKFSDSDKMDKRKANRRFRRRTRQRIANEEDVIPFSIREVSNTWSFASDGLAHFIRCSLSTDEEDKELVKRLLRK